MFKSVEDKDYPLWDVIDLNTGERISGVQCANDETNEYEVILFNKDGSIAKDTLTGKIITKIQIGNIKIVRKNQTK